MKISDLDLYLVEVPCAGAGARVRALLIRLATDAGAMGWGECRTVWSAGQLAGRREALLHALAGRSVFNIEDLGMAKALSWPPLRAAVEMACWDLIGQAAGQPLCHLWGGVYRERIPLAVRLPREPLEVIPAVAREFAEQGFYSQLVTSTARADADLALVHAVREAAGDRAQLRLDGRQAYPAELALDLCLELEAAGLEFFLDPLEQPSFERMARLFRQTSVPLAISVDVSSPQSVLDIVRSGAAPVVVIDLEQVGGLWAARKCADLAAAGRLRAVLGGPSALGVSTAAMLQLAASTPGFDAANHSDYPQLLDDILVEPLRIIDGTLAVPRSPGLGVRVNLSAVEQYLVS